MSHSPTLVCYLFLCGPQAKNGFIFGNDGGREGECQKNGGWTDGRTHFSAELCSCCCHSIIGMQNSQ